MLFRMSNGNGIQHLLSRTTNRVNNRRMALGAEG
jgi:hypothetical protein